MYVYTQDIQNCQLELYTQFSASFFKNWNVFNEFHIPIIRFIEHASTSFFSNTNSIWYALYWIWWLPESHWQIIIYETS